MKRNLIFAGIGVGLAMQAWPIGVGRSRLALKRDDVHFPVVSGFNLEREELIFPRDFAGDLNLLFVPFRRHHQATVDSWIPFAEEIEASYPGVVYYELPTIDERGVLGRTFINEGMRAGIPDPKARRRTVTLYLDVKKFRRATAIPGTDRVHILLVDGEGEIKWRSTGRFQEAKGKALLTAIEDNR